MAQLKETCPFYVLSLDGGGSLGVYTLGILVELERLVGTKLSTVFDLVYGTSTGAIIASLVALGERAQPTIRDSYFEIAPNIMKHWLPRTRSSALERYAREIYGEKTFSSFLTGVGIVATRVEDGRPMVFKRHARQAHGRRASFVPGFGCAIADAVVASCSAYPLFLRKVVSTSEYGDRELVDGGFTANNPALLAIADALGPLRIQRSDIRVLSLGTGTFPPNRRISLGLLNAVSTTRTVMTLLEASSNTIDTFRSLLFGDIQTLRISESFAELAYRTDFIESDVTKLRRIYQLGRESFARNEAALTRFFCP